MGFSLNRGVSQIVTTGGSVLATGLADEGGQQGSALQVLAASLSAGQWSELATTGLWNAFENGGISGQIATFSHGGNTWSHAEKKIYFVGGDHNGVETFVVYDDATNIWSEPAQPGFFAAEPSQRHSYHVNHLNQNNGTYYYYTNSYDISAGTWSGSDLPDPAVSSGAGNVAYEYFPDIGWFAYGWGEVKVLRNGAGSWSSLGTGFSSGDTGNDLLHLAMHYSVGDNVLIFGGGDGSVGLWRVNSDETITQLTNYNVNGPSRISLNSHAQSNGGGILTSDPVSGLFLHLAPDLTFRSFDAVSDTWTTLTTPTNLTQVNSDVDHIVAFPINSYGVTVFVETFSGTSSAKMWVYKHEDSETLESLSADLDVLTIIDFENAGRGRNEEAFYTQGNSGMNVDLDATTDPDGFLRNHVNRPNYATGTKLATHGFSYQPSGNWNSPITMSAMRSGGRTTYPKHKTGAGEFENLTGIASRTCIEGVVKHELGSLGSGDIDIAFKRNEPLTQTSGPYTFHVAGVGTEVWLRFAIWHSQEWIDNPIGGSPSGGPKTAKLSGAGASQDLEFTMGMADQDGPPPHDIVCYSDSGSGPFTNTAMLVSSQHIRDWDIWHLRQNVGSSGKHSGSNGVSVINDPTASYATNAFVGLDIRKGGKFSTDIGTITANTSTTITVSGVTWNNGDRYVVRNARQRLYRNNESTPRYDFTTYDDYFDSSYPTDLPFHGWVTNFAPASDPNGLNPGYWHARITNQHTNKPAGSHPDLPMRVDNIIISKRRIKPLRPE